MSQPLYLTDDLREKQLKEFSVVYSDRSLNHMSADFGAAMRFISAQLKGVYSAAAVALVPGGGTFAMEAVARQLTQQKRCLIIRNGWFSYRWSQIIERAGLTDTVTVTCAQSQNPQQVDAALAPPALDQVVAQIHQDKPEVVFAPHVETSAGMILPDDYLQAVGAAAKAVGALFVLDCIASGTVWVDMAAMGVDVLISAPQKGWSASPCAGMVMMSEKAHQAVAQTVSNSFSCDLLKWLNIMQTYEQGGHAYHATMPTDSLAHFASVIDEVKAFGYAEAKAAQIELGGQARALLKQYGYKSVAAEGFEAPGVIVCHTDDSALSSGKKFVELGFQIAAGVPLMVGEPEGFQTFRIGLFGLDKLMHPEATLAQLSEALQQLSE